MNNNNSCEAKPASEMSEYAFTIGIFGVAAAFLSPIACHNKNIYFQNFKATVG